MGHGKETPRQKMIGMMYLVLTALLALNVQKEVLNAFIIVDEGLTKTAEAFKKKNDQVFSDIDAAATQSKDKAGKFRDLAKDIRIEADKIVKEIQALKVDIVKKADGPETEGVKGEEVIMKLVYSKDNMDIPGEIMIVKKNGEKIRKEIEDLRDNKIMNALKLDPIKGKSAIEAVKKSLDTEKPPAADGVTESWEDEHFNHLPLAGVISILSGIQANVRNAESEALRFLYYMINAKDVKVNKLEGIVTANSNYIISGNKYQAQVFIAASDSDQKPEIFVGDYDPVKDANGMITSYKMRNNNPPLNIKDGKGVYEVTGSGIGPKKWGGIIIIKNEFGDKYLTFKSEYQVAEAALVVSPTKMNVFYIGVDNPVDISVPGVPGDKVIPSISRGQIRKVGNSYIVNVSETGKVNINVTADIGGTKKSMPPKEFRVKQVPDPIAKVGGIKGAGSLTKNEFLAQYGVLAELENFDFDLKFKVTEFTLSTTVNGFVKESAAKSEKFTPDQLKIIQSANKSQKIYIENVTAVGPDKKPRKLGSIALTVR